MHQFEWVVEDDRKVRQYTLERVPDALKTELDAYGRYRSATFAATRDGGAVADITTEADKRNLLRFFRAGASVKVVLGRSNALGMAGNEPS